MTFDVFISYSSKDKATADAACAILESAGVRCWIAPRDVIPGMAFSESIIDAIANAKIMVLIFSGHANASAEINRQAESAADKGTPVVLLRIEDVPMSSCRKYSVGTSHRLDALTSLLETRLAESVKALLKIRTEIPGGGRVEKGSHVCRNHRCRGVSS